MDVDESAGMVLLLHIVYYLGSPKTIVKVSEIPTELSGLFGVELRC